MADQTIAVRRDARGIVFEPLQAHELAGMRNVHVVVTLPGHARGNHYHTRGSETMAVLGPALVCVRQDGALADEHVPAGEVWRFTFTPRVSHAVVATGSENGLVIVFNDQLFDPQHPDTHPDPLFTEDELAAYRS